MLCLAFIIGFGVLTVSGCGGCRDDNATELEQKLAEERARQDKKKADFELTSLRTQPHSAGASLTYFKPGHWTSASLEVVANNHDFSGRILTDPFALDGMPYQLGTSRPAILPKGQPKDLELVFYVPPGRTNARLTARLVPEDIDRELQRRDQPASRMPAHQFYLVVLCPESERYKFLTSRKMLSIFPPSDASGTPQPSYRVMAPLLDHQVSLPSHWLTWTSIAYLIWDGVDPASLSPDQQQSLIDWLHWGGQLIVSGPDSLELLRGSFLSKYLPATGQGELELNANELTGFNRDWTQWGRPLSMARPWRIERLEPRRDGEALLETVRVLAATDHEVPLVVDRRVGRGRTVVTAFRLTQRELALDSWRSFDGFFHACLLGLPPRKLQADPETLEFLFDDAVVLQTDRHGATPAEVNSRVRILSRDIQRADIAALASATHLQDASLVDGGVAGWSSFGGISNDARQALRDAAGIYIPDARFIVRLLALYLLVLVPGNWLLFRLLGRVEWCWIAAPLITLAFAFIVVREAQLDIGFARAQTEIAVVELQSGYPRAHVTRYTALYTSLSTAYSVEYQDGGAVAQPFPLFTLEEYAQQPSQNAATVYYRQRAQGVGLDDFQVRSNSLGMLHSEHTLDLQGAVQATMVRGKLLITNGTNLPLRETVVINPQGQCAFLGKMLPGSQQEVAFEFDNLAALSAAQPQFAPLPATRPAGQNPVAATGNSAVSEQEERGQPQRDRRDLTTADPALPSAEMALWSKFALAGYDSQRDPTLAGNLRLLAWSDEPLEGMKIEPTASQNRSLSLVVANLKYEPLESPIPDVVDPALRQALDAALARKPDEEN